MSLKSRLTLKSYFETNDNPTSGQYADLIDSIPNFVDDAPTFGFNWREAWDNTERYVKYDSVYYDVTGASYVCIKAHDAYFVPTNTTYWSKISEKGADAKIMTSIAFIGDDLVFTYDDASTDTIVGAKTTLTGPTGAAATADAGTTTTLAAGQSATVTNVGTTSAAIFNFAIPQGIQGITGATGAKVTSVAFSGNDIVFTLDDSSTVTLTNAKIDLKGDTGAKIVSGAFSGDDLVFTLDDSSTATVIGAKTDLRGIQGIQGIPGATGNGISNISLISTVGLVKTYRITYTDSTTFDYTVTDGANGTGTLSSIVAGTNISVDNSDVNNPIINNTQDISGKEDVSNKKTSLADNSDTFYPTQKAVKTAVDAKQDILAFTPEDSANKETSALDTSTTKYPCNNVVKEAVDGKMSNPMSATGDIIYGGASGVATRLAKGDDDKVLMLKSGLPSWETPASGGADIIEVQMFS